MRDSQNRFQILVGLMVLAVLGYMGFRLTVWIYHRFAPVPSLSLAVSAWFEPPVPGVAPQLRVAGVVIENGKPIAQDRLRLSVEDWKKGIRQSVFLEIKDGRFESGNQPAFASLTPGDRLRIKAGYEKGGTEATEEIYLGARIPQMTGSTALSLGGVALIASLGFLWLLTGKATPGKNTAAIIASYLAMIGFLAAPLSLPSVVSVMSPETMAAMRETPVGVLVADPGQGDLGRQWVLNVGGLVVPGGQAATPVSAPALSGVTSGPPAGPNPREAANSAPAISASKPEVSPLPSSASPAPSPRATLPEEAASTIQGGLVVPLYVLILAVIGGAINMTRKLPDFQREAVTLPIGQALSSAVSAIAAPVKALAAHVGVGAGKPSEAGVVSEEVSADAQSVTGDLPAQALPDRPEEVMLRDIAEWRKGLITQHMYLLSAPFLAIVVYYLLAWLGFLKQHSLVLVSFSVGLISDKIVSRILGIAGDIVAGSSKKEGTEQSQTALRDGGRVVLAGGRT